MPTKKKLAYAAGILLTLMCLSSLNIAMPMTIKVKDGVTGQPASGAYVVSYLAIRGGLHNFDSGQSLSQVAMTNDQGEAHFGWNYTWVFLNGFQDYNSRILVYKPQRAPHTAMNAFNIRYAFVTYANPKVQEFTLEAYNQDTERKRMYLSLFISQLDRVNINNIITSEFHRAVRVDYSVPSIILSK